MMVCDRNFYGSPGPDLYGLNASAVPGVNYSGLTNVTGAAGSNWSMGIMPPYYVLTYIMKL